MPRSLLKKRGYRSRAARRKVMRMLKSMAAAQEGSQDAVREFLGTGRTGRRNALPDILGQNAQTTCSDLPDRLQALCTVGPDGTSGERPQTTDQISSESPAGCSPEQKPFPADGGS